MKIEICYSDDKAAAVKVDGEMTLRAAWQDDTGRLHIGGFVAQLKSGDLVVADVYDDEGEIRVRCVEGRPVKIHSDPVLWAHLKIGASLDDMDGEIVIGRQCRPCKNGD